MSENQRKRILEDFKKKQGEIVAEFDYELLSNQVTSLQQAVEGLTDIVKADAQVMMRYETRLQSLEKEVREVYVLKNRIRKMVLVDETQETPYSSREIVQMLFNWANGDEGESDA